MKDEHKGCIIEKIGDEYQTDAYNIGRYGTREQIVDRIDAVLELNDDVGDGNAFEYMSVRASYMGSILGVRYAMSV